MTTTITHIKNRQASPMRWQRALQRAFENGLQAFQEASTGMTVVTSGSKSGVCYATDGVTCTCEAAALGADPVCQHRALYWHLKGVLDPEPPAPANVVAFRRRSVVEVVGGGVHYFSDGRKVA